ncbi:hypothetical protein SAMN04515668_1354 [Hymenobacter arizonensis]|uniref:Uncharacterized protein n=1 Tax=Hymenobacter arizonensis TaxID=1227077 RepID=A0A1I5WJM5_HYMAR|nr:hypothetical protein SAMN04515668_1354 [Hymenobacter arizonensis]
MTYSLNLAASISLIAQEIYHFVYFRKPPLTLVADKAFYSTYAAHSYF